MYTIVVGNPWDGMDLHGMYSDFDTAERHAYYYFDCLEWFIKEINPL